MRPPDDAIFVNQNQSITHNYQLQHSIVCVPLGSLFANPDFSLGRASATIPDSNRKEGSPQSHQVLFDSQ
jgi:hypothetical protein